MKMDVIRLFRNNRNICIACSLWLMMFAIALSDRLIWFSDIGNVNINGWICIMHTVLPWSLIAIAPLCIFGRWSRFLYYVLAVVALVVESVEWFVRLNFGMILDGDWVGIVMGSSPQELKWFIGYYLGGILLSTVIILVIAWLLLKALSCIRFYSVTRSSVMIGLLSSTVFFYGVSFFTMRLNVFEKLTGIHLVCDSMRCWRTYKALAEMKMHPKIPDSIRLDGHSMTNVVGIVVLGESATKNHWGLYGYNRNTTPCMMKRRHELTVFERLVSPVSGTAEAMRYIFTTRTIERQNDLRFTLPQALHQVGYDVCLFSNQERWGEWDGDESFDFAGCDPMVFMGECNKTNRYDSALLPYLGKYLSCKGGLKIAFVHLAGSHVPSNSKYPHKGAPFEPERCEHSSDYGNPALTLNHYDNSLWYTDSILEEMIKMLEDLKCPAWLMYFSDHGETPSSKSWRNVNDRDLWDVPFIVWASKEFRLDHFGRMKRLEEASNVPLQTDQLFYGILTFCGVQNAGNNVDEDFMSSSFKPRQTLMIQGGKAAYEWK